MSKPALFMNGAPIVLGECIGRGGEGEVFLLRNAQGVAAKLYTVPDPGSRKDKIQAMIAGALATSTNLVAFPASIISTSKGEFRGFTMRLVSGYKPLHELYAPAARKINFGKADYRFLVRAATNISRAVASVHQSGCVIGDVNHSGILISSDATAALIDADSFQYEAAGKRFLCRVGVPEYTAPELQGAPLSGVVRTVDHDAFALAIVIFQLLFMGRHPFMGAYKSGDMPIEKAIREYRFAYTNARNVEMTPPRGAMVLSDLPKHLAAAFEDAFSLTSRTTRPNAKQWVQLLAEFEGQLRQCKSNPLHWHFSGASVCPWCRMESTLGITLFIQPFRDFPSQEINGNFSAASFDVAVVWTSIEAIGHPDPLQLIPRLPSDLPEPSDSVRMADKAKSAKRLVGIAQLVGAGVLLMLAPQLWFFWLGLGYFGIQSLQNSGGAGDQVMYRHSHIKEKFEEVLHDWYEQSGFEKFFQLLSELEHARRTYLGLSQTRARKIQEYESNRRKYQLEDFLESFLISRSKIKGIGASKLAALASYGIESAADVKLDRVLRVPGFGPTNSKGLIEWRTRMEARFVFSAERSQKDNDHLRKIDSELSTEAAKLRQTLLSGASRLGDIKRIIGSRAGPAASDILRLNSEWLQLVSDCKLLGISCGESPFDFARIIPELIQGSKATSQSQIGSIGGQPTSLANAGTRHGPQKCPQCGAGMTRRVARKGRHAGKPFWGCNSYPQCAGTRPFL